MSKIRISVVICVRNRKDDLKVTLDGFYKQNYKDFEIIVVDNASEDGTGEMISNLFPKIHYIYLPTNINILAQNIGVYHAKGDIIWRTDSDSHPESPDTFSQIINIFDKQPDLHIISTTEVLVRQNFKEIKLLSLDLKNGNDESGFPVCTFSGPGAAIRKVVFDTIGYYWEFGMEENDFSIRAQRSGFNIKTFPKLRTLHYSSQNERDNNERWIKITNQNMRLIVKYYPFIKLHNIPFCYFGSLLEGLAKRLKFSVLIQNIFEMLATILNTWRNERVPFDKAESQKILTKIEYYKGFLSYLKQKLN